MRPIIELMFVDFAAVTLDQIVNQAAKLRYMSGGQIKVPLTIRAAQGGGPGFASQHSQRLDPGFMHAPGLKAAGPPNPPPPPAPLTPALHTAHPSHLLL